MRRRELTPEEAMLWEAVTRADRKLENAHVETPAAQARITVVQRVHMPSLPDMRMAAPLSLGAYAGVDRNTAERFRKGELPLEGTVDLHGMSREKAHHAITRFLHHHYLRGSRFVLAVTGKGNRKNDAEEERGVLREMLP
ncbi:MAG: Smr/MutS family protein, partial [Rickettsiales bacterium]|nr:Smr/MutS family protein [Rickettsiales bacterium]